MALERWMEDFKGKWEKMEVSIGGIRRELEEMRKRKEEWRSERERLEKRIEELEIKWEKGEKVGENG